MSVSTTLNKVIYTGNGTTTVFGYTFYVLDEDDITLYLVDVATEVQTLITTNFTLSPTGGSFPATGGTVTYPAVGTPLPSTKKIVILRETDLLQPTVLPTNTSLKPKVIEMSLDRATMGIQQVAEEVSRCVKVQVGSTTDPDVLVDTLVTASGNAVTAAANAQTSETNAAASALSASTSATNSSNSATASASSALTATNAASTAAQDATDIIAQYTPFRFNSTAYTLGAIARSIGLPSYAYAECTVAGTTGTVEPTWPAVGSTVVDGTVTWLVRDVKQSDTLRTARLINGVSFNGSSDITTITKTNYINSGRKFGTPSGFDLPIEAGDESISYKTVIRTANTITLNPRKAVLVYDKVDGTTGKLEAAYPDSIASTVHRWMVNGDATIASTVGTNALTKTGNVTASDGRVGYAGLGAGGHYTAANATNIPAYASAFTLRLLIDKFVSTGAAQCFYHDGPRKIACNASNNLLVGGVDTGYTLINGNAYIVEVKGAGGTTTGEVFVNGISTYSGAVVVNATAVTPFILSNSSSAELCYSGVGYVEILSSQTTAQTSGETTAKLLFPVCYDIDPDALETTGTTTGTLTSGGGLAAAFSGSTSKTYANAAQAPSAGGTGNIGMSWTSAKKINSITIYGTSDYGFDGTGSASTITLTLQGSNNDGTTWDTLDTASVTDAAGIVTTLSNKTGLSYLTIRVALSSTATTASISVARILFNTDVTRKSLKDILPADSISLGYDYAGSNGITDLNDADWGYARREGAIKGNRIKALPFTSSTGTIAFPNAFGTENVRTTTYFKSSISTSSHTEINPTKTIYPTTIAFSSTGTGYVGGFVEVMEDD